MVKLIEIQNIKIPKINTAKIKSLRVEKGLTQQDLAFFLSIAPNTYQRKEAGTSEFTLSEAIKMSILFEEEIEIIFFNQKVTKCTTKQKSA